MAYHGLSALSEEIAELMQRDNQNELPQRLLDLEHENVLLRAVVDNFPGGIQLIDKDLRLVFCNDKLKRMLDYPQSLFAFGNPSLEQLFRFNANRGEYGPGPVEDHVSMRMELVRQRKPHAYQRVRPCGTRLEVRGVPLDAGGFMTTYIDVGDQPAKLSAAEASNDVDALTGLHKGAFFTNQLAEFLEYRQPSHVAALHCMDLDHFRAVNKQFGRAACDLILKEIGTRLKSLLRGSDPVARIGGDRFAVLQHEVKRPSDVVRLANRILLEISRPIQVGAELATISSSIGFALIPRDGHSVEQLMERAQAAVLETKQRSRGGFEAEKAEWS